jgi:hypothetical protein
VAALWTAVAQWNAADRAHLLQFATGAPRLPAAGASALDPPFTVQRVGDGRRLPTANTCFNTLKLPDACVPDAGMGDGATGETGAETLEQRLLFAVRNASTGFDYM